MSEKDQKIKEVREILDRTPKELKKRVGIIFDGKQYNIRIPVDFVKKAQINTDKDEFEFILKAPEDKSELPMLYGDLVEKEKTAN